MHVFFFLYLDNAVVTDCIKGQVVESLFRVSLLRALLSLVEERKGLLCHKGEIYI